MTSPYTFVADTAEQQFSATPLLSPPGGYRAIEDTGNRRPVVVRSLSEDHLLRDRQRQRLTATGRDLVRNFAIASWALRKHLDYVSRFRFRAKTRDEGFNREYEAYIAEVSQPHRFDLAGRHSRERATRLLEAHRFLDGDAFMAKYAGGRFRGQVELVEGDRVRDEGAPPERRANGDRTEWINGVEVERRSGASLNYAIADRTASGFAPGRVVSARNLIAVGYYDRFDQVRGVGPWAASIDAFKDLDESIEFTRLKVKMHSMAGIKFTRTAEGPLAEYVGESYRTNQIDLDAEADGDEPRYDVDLSGGSIFGIDLDRGDDAEFMESKTPSTEQVDFLKLCTMIALRSCDIPYSFFDESFTNFYGQRGSFLSYLQGVQVRRQGIVDALNSWTRWRVGLAVADGELVLPSGWEFADLGHLYTPVGQPWWDPAKEVTSTALEIQMGLQNPQAACHELDRDYEENIDLTVAALQYAQKKTAEAGVQFAVTFDASSAKKGADREKATSGGDQLDEDLDDGSGEG